MQNLHRKGKSQQSKLMLYVQNESPYNYMTFDSEEECKRVVEVAVKMQKVIDE